MNMSTAQVSAVKNALVRLEDIVVDGLVYLLDYGLLEKAYARKKYIQKVQNRVDPMVALLIQILGFKDPVNLTKHLEEVDKWLISEVLVFQKKGRSVKPLKESQYFELLFEQPLTDMHRISYVKRRIAGLRRCQKLPVRREPEEVLKEIHRILKAISKDLADETFVDKPLGDYFDWDDDEQKLIDEHPSL